MNDMVALKRAVFICFGEQDLGLGRLLGLLGQENSLDVGEDTTLGNGDTRQQLVQLFVVTDGQLQVTGDDPGLLVVASSVSGQLEDFSGQVLHDGGEVDGCASSYALSVRSFAEHTMDTTDGELKSGTARTSLGLSLDFASFSATRHVVCVMRGTNRLINLERKQAVQPLYTLPRRVGRGDASSLPLRLSYIFSARKCRRIFRQAAASSLDPEKNISFLIINSIHRLSGQYIIHFIFILYFKNIIIVTVFFHWIHHEKLPLMALEPRRPPLPLFSGES